MSSGGTRTLEIRTKQDGVFQIDIPEEWRVTFAKVNPASGGYGDNLALRIYEGEEKQRACFTDVQSFRDLSIPIRKRVKKVKAETTSKRDHRGSDVRQKVEQEYEWVDGSPESNDNPF